MRVLFWSGNFWPLIGGAELMAARLLPALQARGYEYVVVTSQSILDLPATSTYRGIPIHRFPFWRSHNNIDALTQIRSQVAELRRAFAPDLVHRSTVGVGDFFHLITANAHPAPLLVTLHGEWLPQADAVVRSTLRQADWVVGCSAAILDRGRDLVPEITTRSSVIYNALDADAVPVEPLPIDAPRLLCLGRLDAIKGFDLALRAFASVVDRFPKARFTIAGDGAERTTLQNQARELGLGEVVEFTGWVAPDAVATVINRATIVVIPSRYESFSLVALQAALMARPAVATRVGGLPEVVVDGETGLLAEREDSAGLAEAIATLLSHPATATAMGQAARRRAETLFSWDRHVEAYDALYRRLILSRRRSRSAPLPRERPTASGS